MEFFSLAKAVRLRSYHDKYLVAGEDEERVTQERDGTSRNAQWTVEHVDGAPHVLRFRSCYGRYLTAFNEPALLGFSGKKVTQSLPARLDSSVEWEPVRDGAQVKLMTRYGNFLRGNGGVPPWRNSVTHDLSPRSVTQYWIYWDVDVVEALPSPHQATDVNAAAAAASSSPKMSMSESSDSLSAPVHKVEDGRRFFYTVADDSGNVNDNVEWPHLTFIGTSVPELTQRLKEETKLEDIIVCTRNPLNQNLIPLYLQLPPNNTTVQLVVVDANSKVAKKFTTFRTNLKTDDYECTVDTPL